MSANASMTAVTSSPEPQTKPATMSSVSRPTKAVIVGDAGSTFLEHEVRSGWLWLVRLLLLLLGWGRGDLAGAGDGSDGV